MKMLIKNVLKFSALVLCSSVFASQAFAEDIELTGTYGSYLKAGCGWVFSSSNNYGPTYGVPNGATTNGVTVNIYYLLCAGNSSPQAVRYESTNFVFIYPNYNNKVQITGQGCGISPGVASVTGNCTDHRVYN